MVEIAPPFPPSATYRFPSGPNFSPLGLFSPPAKWWTFADGPCAHAPIPPPSQTPTLNATDNPKIFAELVLMDFLLPVFARPYRRRGSSVGVAGAQELRCGLGTAMYSCSCLDQLSFHRSPPLSRR